VRLPSKLAGLPAPVIFYDIVIRRGFGNERELKRMAPIDRGYAPRIVSPGQPHPPICFTEQYKPSLFRREAKGIFQLKYVTRMLIIPRLLYFHH
jgi:hypothetical protein